MEKFSLEKYLENPSRKVVTRLKKSVQIISIEGKEDIPIVALVEGVAHQYKPNGYHADVVVAYSNQCRDMGDYDLFFADEGDELTELQKTLEEDCDYYVNLYNDGKTREELREWIKCWCHRIIDLARNELEKSNPDRGNQKQEWGEEDEKNWRHCLHYIDAYVTPVKEHVDWFKNIRNRIHSQQQPKQEWSKEDEKFIKELCNLLASISKNEYVGKYYVPDLVNKLQSFKTKTNTRQELSDEDKVWIDRACMLLDELNHLNTLTLAKIPHNVDEIISHIKSIKDRVQPQPKQEWSEEDEKYWSIVIAEFSKCSGRSVSKDEWMRCNDWLNSLRNRVQLQPKQEWSEKDREMLDNCLGLIQEIDSTQEEQNWLQSLKPNHWKPSEEQLRAIINSVQGLYQCKEKEVLLDLYEQLKQL